MQKRLISIAAFIITLIMLANSLPIHAFASDAADTPMTLAVSSVSGMPGNTVEVIIDVSDNPGLASLMFNVEYDSALTLTNVTFNSDFGPYVTTPPVYTNPQKITLLSPLDDVKTNGTLATLTFEISESAADGLVADVNISFDNNNIFNSSDNLVATKVVSGKISIFHGIPGDIDADGSVTPKDPILLFRYIAGWNVDVDYDALDVDGDASIGPKDAITLFRYVAGWEGIVLNRGGVKHVHDLTYVEGKDATCTKAGNVTYWHCESCDNNYADINGDTVIEETSIPATGHIMQFIDEKSATCTQDGNVAYWNCTNCGVNFADKNGVTILNNVCIDASGHDLNKITENSATCTSNGNVTYWYCVTCNKSYTEKTAENEIDINDTVISSTGHVLQHIEATPATCTDDGNTEYWYCPVCGNSYSDANAVNSIEINDTVISAIGHGENLKKVEAKVSTVDAEGNIEYWLCSVCGKYYSDADAKYEIAIEDIIIPMVESYTITFVDSKNWPAGKAVRFPQNEELLLSNYLPPEVIGYTFVGWYTSSTLNDSYKKDYIAVGNTDSYPLYAKWEAITYDITYKGVLETEHKVTEYTIEDEIYIYTPEWSGLKFVGWSDASNQIVTNTDSNGYYSAKIAKGTTGNIELTANWKIKQNLVTNISDDIVDCVYDEKTERYYFIYKIALIENVVIDQIITSKKKLGKEGIDLTISVTESIEKDIAKTIANTIGTTLIHTNEFRNTEIVSEELQTSWHEDMTIGSEAGIKDIFKVSLSASYGYTETETSGLSFENTVINSDTAEQESTESISSTIAYVESTSFSNTETRDIESDMPLGTYAYVHAGDVQVFAMITFDPADRYFFFNTFSVLGNINDTVLYYPEGYDVEEARTYCEAINFRIPTETIEEKIKSSYYVRYDANGGEGDMPLSLFAPGKDEALAANEYTKTGYTFKGWEYRSDNQTIAYTDGETVRDLAEKGHTITLYACWEPKKYIVKYNKNQGTGGMQISEFIYDKEQALKLNDHYITRNGYDFIGWSFNPDATEPTYTNGQTVMNLSAGEDVTLYAVWRAKEYTVFYDINCPRGVIGTGGTTDATTHTYGTKSALAKNGFTREGYAFIGWSTSRDDTDHDFLSGQEVSNIDYDYDGEVVLFAVWKKNTYELRLDDVTINGDLTDNVAGCWSSSDFGYDLTTMAKYFDSVKFSVKFHAKEINKGYQTVLLYLSKVEIPNDGYDETDGGIVYPEKEYKNKTIYLIDEKNIETAGTALGEADHIFPKETEEPIVRSISDLIAYPFIGEVFGAHGDDSDKWIRSNCVITVTFFNSED